MAKVSLYLDVRAQKKDGTYPVKIKLSHKTKTKLEKTGVDVRKGDWDELSGEIVGNMPMKKQLNLRLRRQLVQLQMSLLDIEAYKDIDRMSIDALMRELKENAGFEVKVERNLFLPFFNEFTEKKEKRHTKEKYITARRHLCAFERHIETLSFEDITVEWLEKFNEWLKLPDKKRKELCKNSRAANMRCIRAVINSARKRKLTTNNVFENFKIELEQTKKRSLCIEEMHKIWFATAKKEITRVYIDMFKLSFCLLGINPIDLFQMKKEHLQGGRLEYQRNKTSKMYNVKVLPEAQEILDRYKGEDEHLLYLYKKYKGNEDTFKSAFNRNLKKVDERLSVYWCRHTWATTAAELDIPNEIISGALGHNYGADVTRIYIRIDQRKIDKANRQVVDAVINNYNPDEEPEADTSGTVAKIVAKPLK